jgi:hypothetical protein
MKTQVAPYLMPPLRIVDGRVATCSLEQSIRENIRLILANFVQGLAKPPGDAADPDYGSDLPHHKFVQGTGPELVQQVRIALRAGEPRYVVDKIEFSSKEPGRYLPYRWIRIVGRVRETGFKETIEFDVER